MNLSRKQAFPPPHRELPTSESGATSSAATPAASPRKAAAATTTTVTQPEDAVTHESVISQQPARRPRADSTADDADVGVVPFARPAAEQKRHKPALTAEATAIARWTADLNDILARANQPMLQFLGILTATLRLPDARYLMTWDDDPAARHQDASQRVTHLVRPAATVAEWLALNRDLGERLLLSYLESVSGALEQQPVAAQQLVGAREHDACFDLRDMDRTDLPGRLSGTPVPDTDLQLERLERNIEQKRAEIERTREVDFLKEGAEEDDTAFAARVRRRRALLDELRTLEAERERLQREATRAVSLDFLGKATELLRASQVEVAFAPAWAWECMGSAVWRRFVRMDALAAVAKAHALVNSIEGCERFSEKELLCSHDVFGNFALLVAYQYLASADVIPSSPAPRGGAGGRGGGHNTYLNIEHMRRTMARRVETCKVWFETHVHRRPNRLLAAFDEKLAAMIAKRPDLGGNERWLASMQRYRDMMPQYELISVVPY